jgi:hypothetical protein
MFPKSSRYYGIETATMKTSAGSEVAYLRRRWLPPAAAIAAPAEHQVQENDRLDNLTARHLGDPEQFWRLCDANNAMHPQELTATVGRRLRIPSPGA